MLKECCDNRNNISPENDILQDNCTWHDVQSFTIEGQGWSDCEHPYDRLPSRTRGVVSKDVWIFSQHSAGICVRFVTNASRIVLRWKLCYRARTDHMSSTGISGVDLYARDRLEWRWVATGLVNESLQCECTLVEENTCGEYEYLLYFPLFTGVSEVFIGINKDAGIRPGASRPTERSLPICFYGTCFTQGASTSRPGMAYPSILGRWLDYPIINLGFSGCGTMELPMAEFLSELDVAAYIIECASNMSSSLIQERTIPFIRTLCTNRLNVPVLIVGCLPYQNIWFSSRYKQRFLERNAVLAQFINVLTEEGYTNLHFFNGHSIRNIGECSVGHHPTDLGSYIFAEDIMPILENLL